MRRTTISLPDPLAARLASEAHRRRTSVSDVVRNALTEYLGVDKQRDLPFIGIVDRDTGPFAADLEDFLAAHWADDIARDSGLR